MLTGTQDILHGGYKLWESSGRVCTENGQQPHVQNTAREVAAAGVEGLGGVVAFTVIG